MYDGINIKEQSIVDANCTDCRSITEGALLFDAKTLKLELRDNLRDQLMQVWLEIKASPPNLGYHRCKAVPSSSLRTCTRTCNNRCAPRGVHRICCFFTKRFATS
jgi:hypothetical protein